MDQLLFDSWSSFVRVIIQSLILFGYTVLLLRAVGKRTTMNMTSFDFISTVVLA